MKQILIASGKGGAGKTCFTASLMHFLGEKVITADCDVDAANLAILTGKNQKEKHDFHSGKNASINLEKCTACSKCISICRFDAIKKKSANFFHIDDLSCEGCGACTEVCPNNAIDLSPDHVGEFYLSETRFNSWLIHAYLYPGNDNSGKLVTQVRNKTLDIARKHNKELILIDGPPGIGCPVIASLSGVDLLVVVAEAGISGISDAKRLIGLSENMKVPVVCLLNKTQLNPEIEKEFQSYLKKKNIKLIGQIAYHEKLIDILNLKKTWLELNDNEFRLNFKKITQNILGELK